jgi:hypothetical protein
MVNFGTCHQASDSILPNVRRFTCTAGAHVPKPTRHGRCRGGRPKRQTAICNGRVAVILVS